MKLKSVPLIVLAAALSIAVPAIAQAPKSGNPAKSTAAKKVESSPAPNDRDIADAKGKGMVWVNTSTKVYHKDGGVYGKTKKGKFMTEDEAKNAGYKAAKEPVAKKAKTAKK